LSRAVNRFLPEEPGELERSVRGASRLARRAGERGSHLQRAARVARGPIVRGGRRRADRELRRGPGGRADEASLDLDAVLHRDHEPRAHGAGPIAFALLDVVGVVRVRHGELPLARGDLIDAESTLRIGLGDDRAPRAGERGEPRARAGEARELRARDWPAGGVEDAALEDEARVESQLADVALGAGQGELAVEGREPGRADGQGDLGTSLGPISKRPSRPSV
jgi:hypothetical protein